MADTTEPPEPRPLRWKRIYLQVRSPGRTRRDPKTGKRKGGGYTNHWQLTLDGWTPDEVRRIIIGTFRRKAVEEQERIDGEVLRRSDSDWWPGRAQGVGPGPERSPEPRPWVFDPKPPDNPIPW